MESTAGPLESAGKIHPVDPPEVHRKSARIRADLQWNRGGLESAYLIACKSDSKLTVSMSMTASLIIMMIFNGSSCFRRF